MTRTTARELAVLVTASMASGGEDAGEVLDRFFAREHYETLAAEGPQFAEYPKGKEMEYIRSLVALTAAHRGEIDGYIGRYAHGWTAARLSRSAAAILRCAICEILYLPDVPPGAAINEAVELAKKYEGGEGAAFINGVLGGFVRGRAAEQAAATEKETAVEQPAEKEAEGAWNSPSTASPN